MKMMTIGPTVLLALVVSLSLAACRWHQPGSSGTLAAMERMAVTDAADKSLRAQWFGVSTLLIRDGETSILIDGFFSRPGVKEILFTHLASKKDLIDAALPSDQLPKIDAVLVSHSHYDHALDAPYLARTRSAILVGSESTLNIGRAQGMRPESLQLVTHGSRLKVGRFEIEVLRTPHVSTPIGGAIDESFEVPARVFDYKLGASFSFLLRHPDGAILVVPSAGSREGMFEGVQADIVFLGIGTLGARSRDQTLALWAEAVERTGARLVVPVHWDYLARPFATPLPPPMPWPLDNVDDTLHMLKGLAKTRCEPGTRVRLIPAKETVSLAKALREGPVPDAPACRR